MGARGACAGDGRVYGCACAAVSHHTRGRAREVSHHGKAVRPRGTATAVGRRGRRAPPAGVGPYALTGRDHVGVVPVMRHRAR